MTSFGDLVSSVDVVEAMETIIHKVHRTPLKQSATLNAFVGANVFLKMENLQKTGSFKVRGAMNKVMSLSHEEAEQGIVAASAGNHAQGVALAATMREARSKIFMPKRTPSSKVAATKHYGAATVITGDTYQETYEFALQEVEKTGATYIHAFDDPKVIAGQGTIALEMLQQNHDLEMIFVPVGGGGLLSGMALAVKAMNPSIKMIGVQALGAPATYERFNGNHSYCKHAHTIADGILVKEPGKQTYPIIRKYVDEMVTVTDEEIAYAIMFMLQREKMLVEGAGAAALAAILCNKFSIQNRNIGCVISGGNADPNKIQSYRELSKSTMKVHHIG